MQQPSLHSRGLPVLYQLIRALRSTVSQALRIYLAVLSSASFCTSWGQSRKVSPRRGPVEDAPTNPRRRALMLGTKPFPCRPRTTVDKAHNPAVSARKCTAVVRAKSELRASCMAPQQLPGRAANIYSLMRLSWSNCSGAPHFL